MADGRLIYIADDEVNISSIIKSFLMKEGYEVECFGDGRSILEAFQSRPADMLVIDVMMPEMDGFSLCAAVRAQSSVPIIIVSARDTEFDRIAGLNLGSDDYLTKPFSPMELIARIKSIFRRMELDRRVSGVDNPGGHSVEGGAGNGLGDGGGIETGGRGRKGPGNGAYRIDGPDGSNGADGSKGGPGVSESQNHRTGRSIRLADVTINPDAKEAQCNGKSLGLTGMEFSLLLFLVENKNRAISRSELLDKIWGFENDVETRATDDMVKRIRRKLAHCNSRLAIETVWGFGFKVVG